MALAFLSAFLVSTPALPPPACAPAKVYVDSIDGDDANGGCSEDDPVRTLAVAFDRASSGTCGSPGSAEIFMVSGSSFTETFTLPASRLLKWYRRPEAGNAPVTIVGTVKIVAEGGVTNACIVRNVGIDHTNIGIVIDARQGSTASPLISGCLLTTTAGASPPASDADPSSSHIALVIGSLSPISGTLSPTITSCTFGVGAARYLARGIHAYASIPGAAAAIALLPSITNTVIDGAGGTLDRGIFIFGQTPAPSILGVTVSPSIATTTVRNCVQVGILVVAGRLATGAPTVSACTVSGNGSLAPASESLGNGITLSATSGGSLAPAFSGPFSTVSANARHGISFLATPGVPPGNSTVTGTVSGFEVANNGTPGLGDGLRLRASGVVYPGVSAYAGAVSTLLDTCNVHNNGNDGISVFAYGVGSQFLGAWPRLAPAIRNCTIHQNAGDGVDASISLATSPFSDVSPLLTHDTVAYNGEIGIRQGLTNQVPPATPGGPPYPTTRVWNSIARFNGPGGSCAGYGTYADIPPPGTCIPFSGGVPPAQIWFTNFAEYDPAMIGYPRYQNGPSVAPPPFFFNGLPNPNFHLLVPSPIQCSVLIDHASIAPPGAPLLDFDGQPRVFTAFPSCITPNRADRGVDEVQ